MAALATADQLIAYIRDPELDRTAAELYLSIASAAVRSATNMLLDAVVEETVLLDPHLSPNALAAEPQAFLPETPVTDVSVVQVMDPQTNTWVTLANGVDYEWTVYGRVSQDPQSLISWSRDPRSVQVTYSHGYTPPMPEDLVSVVITSAARVAAIPVGVSSERLGLYNVKYVEASIGEWSPIEAEIIGRYRTPTVA